MVTKTGDKVWYLDLSTETPRVKQDVVVLGGIFCTLKNYRENLTGGLMSSSRVYSTKEALLAAIDPPEEPILVGYTCSGIWDNKIMISKCFEGDSYSSMPDALIYPTIEDLLKAKQW